MLQYRKHFRMLIEMSKDIGIYTTREKLIHKIGTLGLEALVYWYLKSPPKTKTIRRVYFACGGYWAGYFECDGIEPGSVVLHSWHQIDPEEHKSKQFQGFTYNVPDAD